MEEKQVEVTNKVEVPIVRDSRLIGKPLTIEREWRHMCVSAQTERSKYRALILRSNIIRTRYRPIRNG